MKRLEWLDDVKGLAIALVVAGHAVATLQNMTAGTSNAVMRYAFDAIYSFHIPLFFFLAGITFNASSPFVTFARRKFLRLMIPYFVWGGASALLYIFVGHGVAADMQSAASSGSFAERTLAGAWFTPFLSLVHAGGWPNGQGFRFNGVIWFLPMIFICEIVYYWAIKIFKGAGGALLVATLCMALSSNLTLHLYDLHLPFDLTRVPLYLVFIAVGHWFSLKFVRRDVDIADTLAYYFISIVLVLYVILARYLPISMSENYAAFTIRRFLVAMPAIAVILAASRFRMWKGFGFLAPLSIGIMLFHKFPLVFLQLAIHRLGLLDSRVFIEWPRLSVIVLAFVMTILLTVGCWAASILVARFMPWSLGIWRK